MFKFLSQIFHWWFLTVLDLPNPWKDIRLRFHKYNHLLHNDQGPRKTFEPFLITLEDSCEEFSAFEHPGTEFIYMLEGKLEYRVGKDTFVLSRGDSLTFRGEIPHRPETKLEMPIKFLAIIHYDLPNQDTSED